ncbi:hypothetical protein V1477_008079 [Vespula maculifrons]|uniref:Uncharacterized protein n=1 Tax=Vespula maculifrons TaxID=7453 RepID=A0ABD2CFY4_VESMC
MKNDFVKISRFGEKYTEIVFLLLLTGKFSARNSNLMLAAMAIPIISYQNCAIDIDDTFDKGSNNLNWS